MVQENRCSIKSYFIWQKIYLDINLRHCFPCSFPLAVQCGVWNCFFLSRFNLRHTRYYSYGTPISFYSLFIPNYLVYVCLFTNSLSRSSFSVSITTEHDKHPNLFLGTTNANVSQQSSNKRHKTVLHRLPFESSSDVLKNHKRVWVAHSKQKNGH